MITAAQIPQILEKIRIRLAQRGHEQGLDLRVEDRDYKLEEDWLYVCVYPAGGGIRPYDYAEILSDIERELRDEDADNVLIVPTIPD